MALKGVTTCAVPDCTAPIYEPNNLCDCHRIPGAVVHNGESTMVITIWYAEHEDEQGHILINDWALGSLFSGADGFADQLHKQGFVNVKYVLTPEEFAGAKTPPSGMKSGSWGGPWQTKYPWEEGADGEE
jgi:hypothetical protein